IAARQRDEGALPRPGDDHAAALQVRVSTLHAGGTHPQRDGELAGRREAGTRLEGAIDGGFPEVLGDYVRRGGPACGGETGGETPGDGVSIHGPRGDRGQRPHPSAGRGREKNVSLPDG